MAAAFRSARAEFVRTFANVPFGVSMLAIWGVLTLIGVVVQQNQPPDAYAAMYPPALSRAILRLHFDDIYHSVWYLISIGLVLISMITATFAKVIPRRLPRLNPVKIDAIPLHEHFRVAGTPESVRERIEAYFSSHGWNIRKRSFDGIEWSFADRFNWARIGVLVNHTAILVIAAGTTLYWWLGFSGTTAILVGQSVRIPQTSALIHLDRFDFTIKPIATKSGMVYQPTDYVSHVTVTGKSGIARNLTIRVNHPIDIDGTLYYQASYGFGIAFDVTHDGKPVPGLSGHTLLQGQTLAFPGSIRALQYAQFVPTVDKATGLPAPDPRVNNPAVILTVLADGNPIGQTLVPMGSWVDVGGGWRIVPHKATLLSGIEYRYDPGVPLVLIGALLLLFGLVITFYFLPARLFVRVDDCHDGTCDVGLAATTIKGYDIFEAPFKELCAALATSPEIGDRQ